ncbi:hypothetical protein KUTeg_020332 [Tegillarca granosa]|uniref:Uncharacterized protein n=1 Tax=Tegillarca granosa TaxID=220873 RepID=A0ABQ9ECW8_TEGGR|nr:hypothetical protein KUTeg_020332 [Tegillarca granosa]
MTFDYYNVIRNISPEHRDSICTIKCNIKQDHFTIQATTSTNHSISFCNIQCNGEEFLDAELKATINGYVDITENPVWTSDLNGRQENHRKCRGSFYTHVRWRKENHFAGSIKLNRSIINQFPDIELFT